MTGIDPEIGIFLDRMKQGWAKFPPFDSLDFPDQRAAAEAVRAQFSRGGPVMRETIDTVIDPGAGELRLRVYLPQGASAPVPAPMPALVYLHGGGFTLFSIETHDRLMREYAHAGGFAVIGVDYPLSPEHKYPVALDRIEALMLWLAANGETLGVDPVHLAIGGDSAGANLSVATALRLRDRGKGAILRGILSNYGFFTPEISDDAEARFGGPGSILDRDEAHGYYRNYVSDLERDGRDPLVAPMLAELAGLPPVCLIIPQCDLLTEQSWAMAARLEAAGVAVTAHAYEGATHSFLEAMSIAHVARAAIGDGARFVSEALAEADVTAP